jgi:hypothetical protein
MFIGHFAVAFAGKKVAPKVSLGTLFLAAQFLDVLWPVFVLLGAEHFRIVSGITKVSPFDFYDFPISHSLFMALTWAAAVGLVYFILKGDKVSSLILSGLVFSHWILDVIVHRPDLALLPQGPYWGLGLWNSKVGTILVEFGLLAAGAWIYKNATKKKDPLGDWVFYTLLATLAVFYSLTLFLPPPSNPNMVAWSGIIIIWGFILWGDWADRLRKVI